MSRILRSYVTQVKTLDILFVLLFCISIYTTVFLNRTPLKGNDFDIYIHATQDAFENVPVYEKNYFGAPFSYPPSLFTFIFPFTLLPYTMASFIWKTLSIGLFILTVWTIVKRFYNVNIPQTLFIATIFIISPPFFATIEMGQINLIVLFFTILSFFFAERKQLVWSGVALGIASSLKIIPLFLLIYFLSTKQYKVIFITLVVFIFLNVIGTLWGLSPFYLNQYIDFIHTLAIPTTTSTAYNLMVANSDQSFTAYLMKYFSFSSSSRTVIVLTLTAIVTFLSYLTWKHSVMKKIKTANIEFFCWLLAIVTLFPTTLAWNHHLVFMFPLLMVFLMRLFKTKTIKSFLVFAFAYVFITMDQSIPQLFLGKLSINPQVQFLLFHSIYGFFLLFIVELIQPVRLSFDKFSKVWFTSIL